MKDGPRKTGAVCVVLYVIIGCTKMKLTKDGRAAGSLDRRTLAGTLLQEKLNFRGLGILRSKTICLGTDEEVLGLSTELLALYRKKLSEAFFTEPLMKEGTNEDLYRIAHRIRKEIFGEAVFSARWNKEGREAFPVTGIDQRSALAEFSHRKAIVFYISEPEYLPDFLREFSAAEGRKRFIIVSGDHDGILPDEETLRSLLSGEATFLTVTGVDGAMDLNRLPENRELSAFLEAGEAVFFGFGEDALLSARSLSCPAFIWVTARSYATKALTNLFTKELTSVIYVPEGFDITPYVPYVSRSVLTYYHLAALWEKYGDSVYFETPENLVKRDPGLFLSVYDDHFPPLPDGEFQWTRDENVPNWESDFYAARHRYLSEKANAQPGVRYFRSYLSKDTLEEMLLVREASEKQNNVLIDGLLVDKDAAMTVYPGGTGAVSPRAFFGEETGNATRLVSNFAFFFTEKLTEVYNMFRAKCPEEQLWFKPGYVDYYRYTDCGGRHETFPLYRKPCLGKTADGSFVSFSPELQGGRIRLLGKELSWTASDVNPENPGEIAVYSPLLSEKNVGENPIGFLLPVGEERLNLIIVGERILCAREGRVNLSPIGVVLSLSGEKAELLRTALGTPGENGYINVRECAPIQLVLDTPAGVDKATWYDLQWAYGGGLGLIKNGTAMTSSEDLIALAREGWTTPLSMQTQESTLHTLKVHPRTAVGVTKAGKLVILVFSGRTKISAGVDYLEMCKMARKLVPDLWELVNWDGGASSVLALLRGRVLYELNFCAPSDKSLTGMVRPVNSMLIVGE